MRVLLTLDELHELHAAVWAVAWFQLDPERYKAAKSVATKIDHALAVAKRRAQARNVVDAAPLMSRQPG